MFELLFLSKALSGEEFVPVDLQADSSDSNNNMFIFIIGILGGGDGSVVRAPDS